MERDEPKKAALAALGVGDGRDRSICAKCVGDLALGHFITSTATKTTCTYCGQVRANCFALPLSVVVEHIAPFINEEFKHDDLKSYAAGGGDWYPHFRCFENLLNAIGFWPERVQALIDIASFFNGRTWWWKDTFSDRRQLGWGRFCDVVMHARRYTFWFSTGDIVAEDHPLYMPASRILNEINAVVERLGLITELPIGAEFCRARCEDKDKPLEAPPNSLRPLKTRQQRRTG